MIEQAVLKTQALLLRPLKLSDASAIQKAASARKIADTMISLPHPYPVGEAERYVAQQQAVTHRSSFSCSAPGMI